MSPTAEFHLNEDTPVVVACGILAIVGEQSLRRYAPPPWNEKWRATAVAWSSAFLVVMAYMFLIKPVLPWDAIRTWYYFR